jgi:hypothetical protein
VRWLWEGICSIDIPDGWKLNERDEFIEIVPPAPVGAAHLTVLKRARSGEITDGEARLLAADFAHKQGIPDPQPTETREGTQAVARISFQTADDEGPYYWHVETRVWNGRAVICSYTHGGQDEASNQSALTMFRSFRPAAT